MPAVELRPYQEDAVKRMKNGCILCGGVGSGKSRTALAYYYIQHGGKLGGDHYEKMTDPKDLYIITTARKRDSHEWDEELLVFLLTTNRDTSLYSHKVVVDSWNNISKYADVQGAFFLFDEQRVVGKGAWVKTFLKITKKNEWVLLSATPGDTWLDYIPVFIANGFYKNRTEFIQSHVVYKPFRNNYPVVDHYVNTGKLIRLRKQILVTMDFKRETIAHHENIYCDYDVTEYKRVSRERWNPFTDEPIMNASEYCQVLRRICNTNEDRIVRLLEIFKERERVIIFYNYDYELEILERADYGEDVVVAQWNGHKHEKIPKSERWVYLVQYAAGSEAWNCVETDTIIFYSQNYSWKMMEQASGRIDRMNTPFTDLYYYHFKSRASIDVAISKTLRQKGRFNADAFYHAKEMAL